MKTSLNSRRNFLRQILCWAASGSVIGCSYLPSMVLKTDVKSNVWLGDSIANLESASRIGKHYLASYPEENNVDMLLDKVDEILKKHSDSGSPDMHSFENISSAIRAGYVGGDTVLVDSWILSRTEARLYALVTLTQFD